MKRYFLKPSVLIALGLILLGGVTAEICSMRSKGHHTASNRRVSEQFGDALERAGIQTQAEASK